MPEQPRCSVGVSVSASEDTKTLGFDDRILNRLTIRIAEYFLFKGGRLIFGHDWREDGVMRAVAQLAETAASGGRLSELGPGKERMLNLVPSAGKPISTHARRAQAAGGVLRVRSIEDFIREEQGIPGLPNGWSLDRNSELWVLRSELTRLLTPGLRILLGGRTSGYGGYYAGLVDEAMFAIKQRKPLYLIGGFGGATAEIAKAIKDEPCNLAPFSPKQDDQATSDPEQDQIRRQVAEILDVPLNGLVSIFTDHGLRRLSQDNGLTEDENQALFAMTDIESALALIWRGWLKVSG